MEAWTFQFRAKHHLWSATVLICTTQYVLLRIHIVDWSCGCASWYVHFDDYCQEQIQSICLCHVPVTKHFFRRSFKSLLRRPQTILGEQTHRLHRFLLPSGVRQPQWSQLVFCCNCFFSHHWILGFGKKV